MSHHTKYDLTVLGETVHLEFTRINDSRRLETDLATSKKRPNLFQVKGATRCRMTMPAALAPDWFRERLPDQGSYLTDGWGYCWRKDRWSSKTGRRSALVDALQYFGHDKELNKAILATYAIEEARRAPKPKGPARTPRTPKPRRPGLRATLQRMNELLEKLAHPMVFAAPAVSAEEFAARVEQTIQHISNHPPFVHPVDTTLSNTKENA